MKKIFCRPDISTFIHIIGIVLIVVSSLFYIEFRNILALVFVAFSVIINLISIYFCYFFAINYVVYVDEQKILRKLHKETIEYSWDKFYDCKFFMSSFLRYIGVIVLISENLNFKIAFTKKTYDILIHFCSNNELKKRLEQIWNEHSI